MNQAKHLLAVLAIYSVSGIKRSHTRPGLNIVRQHDGSLKKISTTL